MSASRWAYVVVFDGVALDRFTSVIDRYPDDFENWMTVLPNTVFLVSSMSASEVTNTLREKMPKLKRLLVLDADTDKNGWLPRNAWEFLNKPKPVD